MLERINAFCFLKAAEGLLVFWFAHIPVIGIFKASAMETVLTSNAKSTKSYEYNFLRPWLGNGLLLSAGEKNKERRKILTPAFHFKVLENFIPIFDEQSKILVNKFYAFESEECSDITPYIIRCTVDIIGESAMGVRMGAQDGNESEYIKALHEIAEIFSFRASSLLHRINFFFYASPKGRKFTKAVKILHSSTEKVIKQRKEAMLEKKSELTDSNKQVFNCVEQNACGKKPFLDLLLDMHLNQHLLTEEDIKEEVDTFMFAGHDTTAMGITWSLYCIGLYPHIQKKLTEELDSIFFGDRGRPITLEDLKEMKYLECTFKETQRLYPVAPIIARTFNEDIKIDGISIPRGTIIYCIIYMLHRNPDVFPNPEIFDPDRFLPENTLNRHPYAFIPFSAGQRNCIGQKYAIMEIKVVIANILRHFQIVSLDPRDKVLPQMELVLKPGKPIRLKFIPRVTSS